MELLKSLADTPIPTILVVAGLFFLFLAIGGQIGAKIVTDKVKQLYAAVLGGICVLLGLAIYWMGSSHTIMPQVQEPAEQGLPPAIEHEPEPGRTGPEEQIVAQIQEYEAALKQNEAEQEQARAEIERLQPFLKTDPDARSAVEAQENRLRELEHENQKIQEELERLRKMLQ